MFIYQEFKLNPNAKSFTPNQTALRPASPVTDGSYYYQANVTAVPNMHGIPVAIGASGLYFLVLSISITLHTVLNIRAMTKYLNEILESRHLFFINGKVA